LHDQAPLVGAAAFWRDGSVISANAAIQDPERADPLRDGL
jgi:hypothetical protein